MSTWYAEADREEAARPNGGDIFVAPRRGRRGFQLVALWAGLLALVGGAVFAVDFARLGGAPTAEAAVERLFSAISDEDVLGVLASLPPSERDPLRRVPEIAQELERLGVLSGGFELDGVEGVDLAIEDVRLSTRNLGTGVSSVRVESATTRWSLLPAQLPVGDTLRRVAGPAFGGEPASGTEQITAEDEVELVAIKEGGGWYVSVWYSIAEAMRPADMAPPAFGKGLWARGASSPEAAVREMFEAGARLDARRALELLPPDEGRVLHDYAPLFLDEVEAVAAQARQTGFDVRVDDLVLSAERKGDEAVVAVRSFSVSGVADGTKGSMTFDGRCVTVTEEGEENRVCADDLGPSLSGIAFGSFSVVTVERDGSWFVSPTRSGVHSLVQWLRALDRKSLDEMLDGIMGGAGGFPGWGAGDAFGEEDADQDHQDHQDHGDIGDSEDYWDSEAVPPSVGDRFGDGGTGGVWESCPVPDQKGGGADTRMFDPDEIERMSPEERQQLAGELQQGSGGPCEPI